MASLTSRIIRFSFFSFSVSGYANFALIAGVLVLLLLTAKIKMKKSVMLYSLIGLGVLLVLAVGFWSFILELLMPVIGRFDSIFDIHQHSRLYMLVMPFVWLFDYSFVNSLFGFGPSSYDFLARTKFLYHQGALSGTSNNVFVDLLFEHGLVGFIAFTSAFIWILWRLFQRRKKR